MKKSIIALAVVASMAAQADSTTLYGSVRMAYEYSDSHKYSKTDSRPSYTSYDLASSTIGNSGSRFGIKGEDDLGNGLTAFYKYENRIKESLETNKLYVGLKGGFGELSLGKQNLPTDSLNNNADPFNSYTPGDRQVSTSSDNSLVYWAPDMSGFQLGAAVVVDGAEDTDDNHADKYVIAAKYEANGIFAGLGYTATNELGKKNDESAFTLGLGYSNDTFGIGLVADFMDLEENVVEALADDEEKKSLGKSPVFVRLGAHYNLSEADKVYAGISQLDKDLKVDGKDVDAEYQYSIGYQHKLSSRTKVWTEYSHKDLGKDAESNHFVLGLRTDF